MSAYMVVANRVFDAEKFWTGYAKEATKLVTRMGGKYRILADQTEVLEGESDCEGALIVLVEWPDAASCRRFWNSPEYAEVKKLREGIAHARVWLTETDWLNDEDGPAQINAMLGN